MSTFHIITGIRAPFVDPNFHTFGDNIRSGTSDAVLVQSAPPFS